MRGFCSDETGGLVCFESPAINSYSYRWHSTTRPNGYDVSTTKPAIDDGKPAQLRRHFRAICDDFGTLVEVVQ